MNKIDELKKRRDAAIESEKKIILENSPVRVKAEFIGCKTCGTGWPRNTLRLPGKLANALYVEHLFFQKRHRHELKVLRIEFLKLKRN